jgi:hypothetical protein
MESHGGIAAENIAVIFRIADLPGPMNSHGWQLFLKTKKPPCGGFLVMAEAVRFELTVGY